MATGDLIVDSDLLLAIPDMATVSASRRAGMITASSLFLRKQIGTVLASTVCQDEINPGHQRLITLKQRPVIAITRIESSCSPVLVLAYSGGAQRASVVFDGANVTLTSNTLGVLQIDPFPVATYPIVSSLAAAIAGVSGWTATIPANMGSILTDTLDPIQGGLNAKGTAPASLWAYTSEHNDFDLLSQTTGEVMLYRFSSDSYSYPDQVWAADKRSSRIRITYAAGYATIPQDLKEMCVGMCVFFRDATPASGLVVEEKMGEYSYKFDLTPSIPVSVQVALSNWTRERRRL
jgi:hypothetical protein